MKMFIETSESVDRNKVAAILSVLPGLGHIYKHHYLAGFGILTVGNTLMVFIALLLGLATLGLSVVVVPAAWIASIAYSAYNASDEHGHHPWLDVWRARCQKAMQQKHD